MTDDLRELQRRLEQATECHGPSEESLEPETVALRAGWLALGELLEAAQPEAAPRVPPMPLRPAPRPRRWPPTATVAVLAASMLVAVSIVWSARGFKPTAIPSLQSSHVAGGGTKLGPLAARQTPATPSQQTTSASSNGETWDDALDQQITAVANAMVSVQEDWHAPPGGLSAIEYQLQQIKKDIEGDTL
jgi:hypothetical protein